MTTLYLDALTLDDCRSVRLWRNQVLESLRTPYPLTIEQQDVFYERVVSDRTSPHRYYAVRSATMKGRGARASLVRAASDALVAMVGLTNIIWENRSAEISLIVNPTAHGHGSGSECVRMVLIEAFERLDLALVYGESYECNPAVGFWRALLSMWGGYTTTLPSRKFWGGRRWDSLYFSWSPDVVPALKGDHAEG